MEKIKTAGKCDKCKEKISKVQIQELAFCNECFMDEEIHKFKLALRTRLRIWKDDFCLACIDGGIGSLTMLDLIDKYCGTVKPAKVYGNLTVFHIDESSIYNGVSFTENVLEPCKKYNFDYVIMPLEYIFELTGEEYKIPNEIKEAQVTVVKRQGKSEKKPSEKPKEKIEGFNKIESKIYEKKADSTKKLLDLISLFPIKYKREIASCIKKWLILQYATNNKFTKILFSENANSISTRLFDLMVSGRGQNIALDSDYADGKYGNNMIFCRTMRDFIDKEIYYYSILNNIKSKNKPYFDDLTNINLPGKGSSELIIKSFLTQLQVFYKVI